MQKIAIVGASSLGRCAMSLANRFQANIVGFLDDNLLTPKKIDGLPYLGPIEEFQQLSLEYEGLRPLIAIGDAHSRLLVFKRLLAERPNLHLASAIHSSVTRVGPSHVDSGCIIFPGVVIGAGVQLGRSVVINSNVTIGAGSVIKDFSTVGPGANIGSEAAIGCCTFIGMGAAIAQGTTIGDGCTIGALSFVRQDIPNGCLAVGTPAALKGPRIR